MIFKTCIFSIFYAFIIQSPVHNIIKLISHINMASGQPFIINDNDEYLMQLMNKSRNMYFGHSVKGLLLHDIFSNYP